ncbi:MAG: AAA family ATPase [Candidatus Diapherotrites archaeon]|nr:AAA family ATPase [Candidatus Diapherotrites archaeon]
MKLLLTGSPGTGKTTIAKRLAKKLGCFVVNERDLALEKGIGKWDHADSELVIPLGALKKAASAELKKHKNIILEGHILCEVKLPVDAVILLRTHPELLEARLGGRGYAAEKVQDNVFCEGIDYCKKHALRNYGSKRIIEVRNEKGIKETLSNILEELRRREIIGQ